MKLTSEIQKRFSGIDHPVFKSQELDLLGIDSGYKKRLVHLMTSDKRITRITRGVYTFHKDSNVVGFAFSPFYYGLEDALTLRKVSVQGTNPVVVTVRNVRQGRRSFNGRNYIVKRIPQNLFFGYGMIKAGEFWVPVSDLEKTVIDMLYLQKGIRDELWAAIAKKLDRKRLDGYLKRYSPGFGRLVLDYVKMMREGQKG